MQAIVYYEGTIDGVRLRISQTEETGPNGSVWLERLDAPIERENYGRASVSVALLDLLAMWTSSRTRKGLGASFTNLSKAQRVRVWEVYPEVFAGTEDGATFAREQAEKERAARSAAQR